MTNDQVKTALTSTLAQIVKLLLQAQNLTSSISTTNPSPNPLPVTPVVVPPVTVITPKPVFTPHGIQTCFQFDIHCEKSESQSSKFGVILTAADFNILKQNVHYFAVIPANPPQIQAVPNISIHDLQIWIIAESITPVPHVPTDDV